ncbi:MAG: undecaprenyl-diphosphate phosphatase, partial [Clostridia bacterium]|nr:undecaprenyl-diphosphate phosphatase [Clostridia bacterium]
MSILEAIIYGFIQGVAEFLPVSSSGHLALAQNFFGSETENGFAFNIALHLATLISVCVIFRKDVIMLIKSFFSLIKKTFTGRLKQGLDSGERLFLMLCLATLPLIPIKLLGMDDKIEELSKFSWVIGILLIINGTMLVIIDKLKTGEKTVE